MSSNKVAIVVLCAACVTVSAQQATAVEPAIRIPETSLSLTLPRPAWLEDAAARVSNPDATLILREAVKGYGLKVIVQHPGPQTRATSLQLVQRMQEQAVQFVNNPQVSRIQPLGLAHLEGQTCVVAGTDRQTQAPIYQILWGTVGDGQAIQISLWGPGNAAADLLREWQALQNGFHRTGIFLSRVSGHLSKASVYPLPDLGLEITPSSRNWVPLKRSDNDDPRSPAFMLLDRKRDFKVIVLSYVADPEYDSTSETTLQTYLEGTRMSDPNLRASETVPIEMGDAPGTVATVVWKDPNFGERTFVLWTSVHAGVATVIILDGPAHESEAVRKEFDLLRAGLRRIPVSGNSSSRLRGGVERFSFSELNLEMKLPAGDWTRQTELEAMNPDEKSRMFLDRTRNLLLVVVVEEVGTESGLSVYEVMELHRTTARQRFVDPKFGQLKSAVIEGLAGKLDLVEGRLRTTNQPAREIYWATMHNGRAYQFSLIGGANQTASMDRTWQAFQNSFRLIDRDSVVETSRELTTILQFEPFGFRADLSGLGWFQTKSMTDLPGGEFVAARAPQDTFITIPLSLHGTRPQREDLIAAALKRTRASLDDLRLHAKRVQHGSLDAIEFREPPNRLEAGMSRYIRIVFGTDNVWIMQLAFRSPDQALPEQLIADTMQRVIITPPGKSVSPHAISPDHRDHQVVFLLDLGEECANDGRRDEGLEFVRAAYQVDPENLLVLEQVIDVMLAVENYPEALELFETAPVEFEIDPARRAQHAWMLAEAGRHGEALQKYSRLFQTSFYEDRHFERYVTLLAKDGESDQAIQLVDARLDQNRTVDMIVLRAQLISESGRTDQAIDELKRQRDAAPLAELDYSWALINLLLDAERNSEALAEVETLVSQGHKDTTTGFLKGLCEFRLERFTQARDSFQAVVDRSNDPLARQFLEMIAAQLGQGDVSDLNPNLEPVPLPDGVALTSASPDFVNETDDAWIALEADTIRYVKGEEYRRTQTLVVHPLTREGVEHYGSLRFGFDPLYEDISVNRVDVFDAHGKRVGSTDIHDCYVLASSDNTIVTRDKVLHIPVQGLRPGGRLEVQVTRLTHATPDELPFRRIDTKSSVPVARFVVSIEGDTDQVHWAGPAPIRTANTLLWNVRGRRAPDVDLADHTRLDPLTIHVGDAGMSWEKLASDYLERIADRLTLDPQLQSIAQQKLAPLQDAPLSKRITRLAEWARDELTYQGLEFGVRGQVMPAVSVTLKNRYGDCKDHSLLLWQLLRAADIPAHLALVNAGDPVNPDVPDAAQFNHMILFVTDELGDRLIDGTDKFNSPSLRVPNRLAGKLALILDAENPRLIRMQEYAAGSSQCYVKRELHIQASGEADVTETHWMSGYRSARLRRLLTRTDQTGRRSLARFLFLPADRQGCRLKGVTVSHEREPSKFLTIEVQYTIRDLMTPTRNQLIGRLPASFESTPFLMHAEMEPDRIEPFRPGLPLELSSRTEIHLPEGFAITSLPDNLRGETNWADIRRGTTRNEDVVTIETHVTTASGSFQTEAWPQYQQVVRRTADVLTPRLFLERAAVQAQGQLPDNN